MLKIDQLRITSYRPSANGRCEIINKTLHSLLGRVVADNQRDWVNWLPMCTFAYNTNRHESLGMSPQYLMFSREAIIPLDLLLEHTTDKEVVYYHEYAEETVERMRKAFEIVQKHQNTQVERMKRYYNVAVKPRTFHVNDLVYYYYPRRYAGRTPKWSRVYTGIFRVEKVVNDSVYIIRRTPHSRPITVNVDKLKLYSGEAPVCWRKLIVEKNVRKESSDISAGKHDQVVQVSGPMLSPTAVSLQAGAAENSRAKRPWPANVSGPDRLQPTPAARVSVLIYGLHTRPPMSAAHVSGPMATLMTEPDRKFSGHSTVGLQARRPASTRIKQRPARYCLLVRMKMEHTCAICGFLYRSRGSCHKHTVKKHGMRYDPGRSLEPIPAEELADLLETYQRADRNSRQRRRDECMGRERGRRHLTPPSIRSESPPVVRLRWMSPSPHRQCKPAGTGLGPIPAAAGSTRDLATPDPAWDAWADLAQFSDMEFDQLDFSSSTERLVEQVVWSSPRVCSIRTAAAWPAGDESPSSDALPVGLSRPETDGTDPPAATAVRTRPTTCDASTDTAAEQVNRATDPPSVTEMGAWQLPPGIDVRSIAVLMVHRPTATPAAVQMTAEQFLPRADKTEYGQAAMRLYIQAMHEYERVLTQELRDIATASYQDDHTGWTAVRASGRLLDQLFRRDGDADRTSPFSPEPYSPPPEDDPFL